MRAVQLNPHLQTRFGVTERHPAQFEAGEREMPTRAGNSVNAPCGGLVRVMNRRANAFIFSSITLQWACRSILGTGPDDPS